ncbi:hypothetical protein [Streptomyces sp. YIM 98790]|uniref:hypothetical protein n=1 Tax=Streptomyces sp. YIM 98790 TaxID=2689077 RepID=UPI001408A94B|nr:hypothetical protein [Streptomyces sp. YIM 98790]
MNAAMTPVATRQVRYGHATGAGGRSVSPLPAGLSPAAAGTVLRTRRFGQDLYVTRAAERAVSVLWESLPEPPGTTRLGLVLATDRGDQHALLRRMPEFASCMRAGGRASADLFRAIAYFPTGRVTRSVAQRLRARGPVATVPAGGTDARRLAGVWLAAGRADHVVTVTAELTGDHEATATATLWHGTGHSRTGGPADPGSEDFALAVPAGTVRPHHGDGVSWSGLVQEALARLAPAAVPGRRSTLVLTSMLADAGETAFAGVVPRDPGPSLPGTVRSLTSRMRFDETFVLVGSSGGGMTALALAQDLLALGRTDEVVVCGADLVHGALAHALGVLRCPDLPHMRGDATALRFRPAGPEDTGRPIVRTCALLSPQVPDSPNRAMELTGFPVRRGTAPRPAHVALSGLNAVDLAGAERLAAHMWPGVPVRPRGDVRSVGADVLRRVMRAAEGQPGDLPMAVAGVHSLGGSGYCLVARHERAPGRSSARTPVGWRRVSRGRSGRPRPPPAPAARTRGTRPGGEAA